MKKSYRNMAFLTELLVNVLVFSISCAILAGLFVKASSIAKQTKEESFAGVEIYALFETMRAYDIDGLEHAEKQVDGSFLCGYDSEWRPTPTAVSAYIIRLDITTTKTDAGVLQNIEAKAQKANGNEICQFETAIYLPMEGGQGSE